MSIIHILILFLLARNNCIAKFYWKYLGSNIIFWCPLWLFFFLRSYVNYFFALFSFIEYSWFCWKYLLNRYSQITGWKTCSSWWLSKSICCILDYNAVFTIYKYFWLMARFWKLWLRNHMFYIQKLFVNNEMTLWFVWIYFSIFSIFLDSSLYLKSLSTDFTLFSKDV